MSTRQDYITAIGHLVGGELPLGETEKVFAINSAVKRYSRVKPQIIVEDEDGAGVFDYALTMLASWSDDFSSIRQVEYPVDAEQDEPNIIEVDDWMIYEKPDGKYLRFLADTPSATEDMRITYTAPHACTDVICTISSDDEEAVQMLAAAIFCEMLAAYYAQTQDSTVLADSVDHKSKSSEYSARAKRFQQLYKEHLGVKDDATTPAASSVSSLDMKYPGGTERLTHQGWARKRR